MKKVFIIHGWSGSPDEPLHKWLASELEKNGFEVEAPRMPDPDYPKIETWVPKLKEVVGDMPNENIIFIGHSIGCQSILRYLAELKAPGLFGGFAFIAPWLKVSGLETEEEESTAKPWVETSFDRKKASEHMPKDKIVAIFSDNDPFVPKENWEIFENNFHAKTIVESNKGHFIEDDGVENLPSALEAVLKMK